MSSACVFYPLLYAMSVQVFADGTLQSLSALTVECVLSGLLLATARMVFRSHRTLFKATAAVLYLLLIAAFVGLVYTTEQFLPLQMYFVNYFDYISERVHTAIVVAWVLLATWADWSFLDAPLLHPVRDYMALEAERDDPKDLPANLEKSIPAIYTKHISFGRLVSFSFNSTEGMSPI